MNFKIKIITLYILDKIDIILAILIKQRNLYIIQSKQKQKSQKQISSLLF